jgi:hypothetical protein
MVEKSATSDGKVNVFGSDDANRRLAKIKEGGGAANAGENKEDTKAAASS